MTFTVEQMRAVFPHAPPAWAPAFDAAWREFGLIEPSQQVNHLAVIGNESGGLTGPMREDMRYTAAQALGYWPKCRADPDKTRAVCSRGDKGVALANWVYADLYGNGPESSGDGWRCRGHGPIQVTFRGTLTACGWALGIDAAGNPELLCDPVQGARSATWFVTAYKPEIARAWRDTSVSAFLSGAKGVGWTDDAHTAIRLDYRRKAAAALGGAVEADGDWLRLGSRGPAVQALQKALNLAYGPRLAVDGDFGPATATLVKDFQRANGLEADGIVGPKTRAALRLT